MQPYSLCLADIGADKMEDPNYKEQIFTNETTKEDFWLYIDEQLDPTEKEESKEEDEDEDDGRLFSIIISRGTKKTW